MATANSKLQATHDGSGITVFRKYPISFLLGAWGELPNEVSRVWPNSGVHFIYYRYIVADENKAGLILASSTFLIVLGEKGPRTASDHLSFSRRASAHVQVLVTISAYLNPSSERCDDDL